METSGRKEQIVASKVLKKTLILIELEIYNGARAAKLLGGVKFIILGTKGDIS